MASITIRNLDDSLKRRLRMLAARHGCSMEHEVREILRVTLANRTAPAPNLAEAVRRRFEPLGGVELKVPQREPTRKPPGFHR